MVNKIILAGLVVLLVGCGKNIKPEIITIKVPVNICPVAVKIDRPVLPLVYINNNSDDESVVKAYKQSIIILQNYSIKLEKALEVYK